MRPADPVFDRLMNNRYYRLRNITQHRTYTENVNLRKLYNNLVSAATPTLDGEDSIAVFQFLTRFVEEADVQQLSEAQESVLVSLFLTARHWNSSTSSLANTPKEV